MTGNYYPPTPQRRTMDPIEDIMIDDLVSTARSRLPIYVVADSPEGPVLSFSDTYPDDDTMVWMQKSGSPDSQVPLSDVYAQYGDDVIAYAEPEPVAVTAAVNDPDNTMDTDGDNADDMGDSVDNSMDNDSDNPDDIDPDADVDDVDANPPLDRAEVEEAFQVMEQFLDRTEQMVSIVAALRDGALANETQRKAVGGNPDAQAEAVVAFETKYVPGGDVDTFVESVLGPRPGITPNHDADAWDAMATEARTWHTNRTATDSIVDVALED